LAYISGLVRYFWVGVVATLADWFVFALLIYELHWNYLYAGATSFAIGTVAGYLTGFILVFRGGRHARSIEILLVFAASAAGLLLHTMTLYLSVEFLGVWDLIGKLIATAVTFIWNYSARYYWIFEK